MEYTVLNNGVKMPMLGFGVFQTPPADTERCVLDAIDIGYRSIDTAQAYRNEEGVGKAIAKCGVPRGELFITTKIWASNSGYDKAKASIDESLRKLQTSYADLILVHQPFGDYYGTWRALEEAYKEGKARAIGVSNFYPDRLIDLNAFTDVTPAVNQVETHVFHQQKTARKYMDELGVKIEAWAPLVQGLNGFFDSPVLMEIGNTHGKTIAQTALRFLIQSGIIVIPKSVHKERMKENFEIFDFELTPDEMAQIEAMDEEKFIFSDHHDPEKVKWFVSSKV